MLDAGKDRIHKGDVSKIAGVVDHGDSLLDDLTTAGFFMKFQNPVELHAKRSHIRPDGDDVKRRRMHGNALAASDPGFFIPKITTAEGVHRLYPVEARDLTHTYPERYSPSGAKKLVDKIALVRENARVRRSHTTLLLQKHKRDHPHRRSTALQKTIDSLQEEIEDVDSSCQAIECVLKELEFISRYKGT